MLCIFPWLQNYGSQQENLFSLTGQSTKNLSYKKDKLINQSTNNLSDEKDNLPCVYPHFIEVHEANNSETKFIPQLHVKEANCAALFQNSSVEQKRVKTANISIHCELLEQSKSCERYRNYLALHSSEEEKDFPIAFSIIMYKDTAMAKRLLRAIYRPHNVYCIHVDKKTKQQLHDSMAAMADCFHNVIVTSERVKVKWGTMSVVDAELSCMRTLWRFAKWKYLINLTGQEFPLKTNKQLVRILKSFNGSNAIDGSTKW